MPARRPAVAALALGLAFGLAFGLAPVAAEDATLGQVEFEPASFIPGELVTLYARLDPGPAPWREEAVSSGFAEPSGDDPSLVSVALEKRSGSPVLVVRFVAWRAGPGMLPAFSVGGLDMRKIRFECGSALEGGDSAPPRPMPQLDPPGLYPWLYAMGGAFVVAAAAAALAAARAGPWFRALMARWSFAAARRDFDAMLGRLSGGVPGPAAWAELCSGARRFIGLRSGADWMALTPSEVAMMPAQASPGDVVAAAAALLSMGDAARFAGKPDADLAAGIELARSIADRIDAACAPRARGRAAR